jgi:hypothetical protein
VVNNIKVLSARHVDMKTSVIGYGGSGFFVLFGSGGVMFGADSMLALLQYAIDMDDAFLRTSALQRATKGVSGIMGGGFRS